MSTKSAIRASLLFGLLVAGLLAGMRAGLTAQAPSEPGAAFLSHLRWRLIGPYRGGRVTAVTGVRGQPLVYYMGTTGGGVWKTDDAGLNWFPVSDGFFRTGSVGAVTVADSDPNVVYAGMGEACLRGDISHGDGVYKSEDAGDTWKHVGLGDTRHIGQIRVHPRDPNLVYVAALGHVFGPNKERGVFRSKDGGQTWEQVLFVDENSGAIDLAMGAANPRVMFAAIWQVRRASWGSYSGGPGSGLYKSTDGGTTWRKLENGLPAGPKGRIGVSVSPVNPNRVWALVEAERGGMYRSDDGGESWRLLSEDFQLRRRAEYYSHVYADTQDGDTVYVLTAPLMKSVDAGRTYEVIPGPHGDHHALWIAPEDNRRMINGNDGGATVTMNGGKSWTTLDNQPTAQFYHVIADNQFPYRVYGAQQDNTTVSIPSRTNGPGIDQSDWYAVGGGESGYVAPHSTDPNIVFAGSFHGFVSRYDHRRREIRNITVWPDPATGRAPKDVKYRFQWTAPLVISPHDPNTMYMGGNVLFKTTTQGQSWEPISGDLTRNDKSKQVDGRLTDFYCTIFAVAESPKERGLIWTGSDDGLVHVTRDGGKTWRNVTPKVMQEWTRVSIIEPSPHDAGVAYVAANRYQVDDYRPYIYKTTDYGTSWTLLTNGLRQDDFVRSVRVDPKRPGLLYAGTETGAWFSVDDGAHWTTLQLNLPAVPVHDLAVKDDDLIVATHGRAFWILDDLTALQQWTPAALTSKAHLFRPRATYRVRGGGRRAEGPIGENPPTGVQIRYNLRDKPKELTLDILDAGGTLIKSFKPRPAGRPALQAIVSGKGIVVGMARDRESAPADAGMNVFEWDMRHPDARGIRTGTFLASGGSLRGPLAVPGQYQARLTVDGTTTTQPFEIAKDPRSSATQADLQQQFDLLVSIRDKLSAAHDAVNVILDLRDQLDLVTRLAASAGISDQVVSAAKKLGGELKAVLDEIVELRFAGIDDQTLLMELKLNNRIGGLGNAVATGDEKPTGQSLTVFGELSELLAVQTSRLSNLLTNEVAAFNALVRRQGLPAIAVKPPGTSDR